MISQVLKNRRGSILLEGLITLTLINVLIVLIFGYIRTINEGHTNKIHKERATLLMIDTVEKIRSSRDTEVNRNYKTGWDNFTKTIDENNPDELYVLRYAIAHTDTEVKGQYILERENEVNKMVLMSSVSPYADYSTTINSAYQNNDEGDIDKNKLVFDVTVRWREAPDPTVADFYSINQQMILTNHVIYENLF